MKKYRIKILNTLQTIIKIIFIPLICSCSNNLEEPEGIKLFPPNETITDQSLIKFLSDFENAIANHDTTFIINNLSEKVHLSFGSHAGINDFRDIWNIDQEDSKLWTTLQQIMDLGGTLVGYSFIAPYVFTHWPAGVDGFLNNAIIARDVNLREAPDTTSRVITLLSYDVVKVIDYKAGNGNAMGSIDWCLAETLDGRNSGYLNCKYLRSPIDYRIFITRRENKWSIRAFIAGD